MTITGQVIDPAVHQDELRTYTGGPPTKFYHGNQMHEIKDNGIGGDPQASREGVNGEVSIDMHQFKD